MDETQFFRRDAAAAYLKEKYGFGAARTLAKGAVTGDTPEFHKAGRIVLYTREALDAWALAKIGARSPAPPRGPRDAMAQTAKSPPASTGGARKSDCLEAVTSETIPPKQDLQALLPSRATLGRRWPRLRVNRLTWRWRDDATGAKGNGIETLLEFIGGQHDD